MQHLSFQLDHFDPLLLMQVLTPDGPGFLESQNPNPRTGAYSILPLRAVESYRLDASGLVCRRDGREQQLSGPPLTLLSEILNQRSITADALFPGGFFGYFGYDLATWLEDLPTSARRDLPVPQLWLDWVDLTAVYDHAARTVTLASLRDADDLEALAGKLLTASEQQQPNPDFTASVMTPDLEPARFQRMVERARDYIAAGDIYQANLSVRFSGSCSGSSAELYRRLRQINPSPFACYLKSPGMEIISASPERLVSLHCGRAETRPIAGTRRRGGSPNEDENLKQELLAHPKERAEHIMLLDLERNDLGKVCRAGTVTVDELMVLEQYSHVTHIVSNVSGELASGYSAIDLFAATFPGGTITGVPKKRCMEIIDELEPTGRGSYTGSAGYLSVTGHMDLNILIRTLQRFDDRLTFQVGAGIVADSIPQREWQECLNKGEALMKALQS
jgi:para-aminobenzoate synthetase component I